MGKCGEERGGLVVGQSSAVAQNGKKAAVAEAGFALEPSGNSSWREGGDHRGCAVGLSAGALFIRKKN